MSKLKKTTIGFMRDVLHNYVSRPAGIFLFIDKEYPNSNNVYSVVVTNTTIAITKPDAAQFLVTYEGKSSRDVARELNNCPFPIEVRSLVNVKQLAYGEIFASGTEIPFSFDTQDITSDGKGAILRVMRYMCSYKRLSAIKLSLPVFNGPNLPWWPRVTKGEFTQLFNQTLWTFGVPEFENQSWSKTWGRPFRDVEGELARFTNSTTIKLAKGPVLWRGNNIVLSTPGDDGLFPSKIVKDVDEQNGIVYLRPGTVISKDVLVHYTYHEAHYSYNKLDINSHFTHNPSLLNSFILIYARPHKSSQGASRTTAIYHSTADSLEAAIGLIPEDDAPGFAGAPVALLGAISIRPSIDKSDMTVLDTRSYGGGLLNNPAGHLIEDKMVRSNLFMDIARKDGIPYGGSAAVLLELPPELKEVMGLDEIKNRAQKFLAAGVYPVTRFKEEDYYSQFETSVHNTDVSLIDFRIQNVIDADSSEDSNLIADPEDFVDPDSAWDLAADCTGTDNTDIAPNGTLTADTITADGISPQTDNVTQDVSITSSTNDTFTFSIYIQKKTDGSDTVQIIQYLKNSSSTNVENFSYSTNLTTGVLDHITSTTTAGSSAYTEESANITITSEGDYWRIGGTITDYGGTAVTFRVRLYPKPQTGLVPKSIVLWGAQLIKKDDRDPYLRSLIFGGNNSIAYWIDDDLTIPANGVYGEYTTDDLPEGPIGTGDIAFSKSYNDDYQKEDTFLSGNVSSEGYHFSINQGKSYYIPYLRSNATPIFSYEERYDDTPWTRKTVRDDSNVNDSELAVGKVRISADYGVKHVRNFTGFAGVHLDNITGELWTKLGSRCANIFTDIQALTTGEYGLTVYEVPDVSKTATALKPNGYILPGVDPLYEPWLKNYDTCTAKNFYKGSTEIGSAALYNYKATNYSMSLSPHPSGDANYGAFPRKYVADASTAGYVPDVDRFATIDGTSVNSWHKDYEAIRDLTAYSRYSTYRSNELAASGIADNPSILVPDGAASWLTYDGDAYAEYAHSGSLQIAQRIHFCHYAVGTGWYGGDFADPRTIPNASGVTQYNAGLSDIIAPVFNSNLKGAANIDAEDMLLTGYSTSEVSTDDNELYKRAMYTEAFAAFYATFPCPPSGEHTKEDVFVHVSGNPRNIAMSGIAMCNETFMTGHFIAPTYKGDSLQDTWLTKYNRLSKLGSIYTNSVTNAYDSLYYGNKEWAGYKEYETKTSPYYSTTHNTNPQYRHDLAPNGTIKWYDGVERGFEDSLKYSLSGLYTNMIGMKDYIEVGAKRGGTILPGYIDLIRSYLWLPTHSGNGDILFDPSTNAHLVGADFDSLVKTFEVGMGAAIKGCFAEDGILKEGGSFKGEAGPYATIVPSTLFKACGDAIKYYSAIGNKTGEYKWTAVANGLFNTSERLHNLVGGYPTNATHELTSVAGDVGSVPLDGYLYLLGAWTGAFTNSEFSTLTGAAEGRF
jgi:hypothetical protein